MMQPLVEILDSGNHSLVIENGGAIRTFDGRGVADLHRLLTTQPSVLKGAMVADKVVGRGAAALIILGGVRGLFARVISRHALALLHDSDVTVTYTNCVDSIINRAGTGPCPVEALCADCRTAEECLPLITKFLSC